MLDFADIFLKIMYEKIIETTILKLSIGTTAPVQSLARLCNSRVMNSLLQHMKGRYRRIYFWHLFTADCFLKNKQHSNYEQRLCGLLFRNLIKFLLCF